MHVNNNVETTSQFCDKDYLINSSEIKCRKFKKKLINSTVIKTSNSDFSECSFNNQKINNNPLNIICYECWLRLNYCYKAVVISTICSIILLTICGLYFGFINPKYKVIDDGVRKYRQNELIPPNPEVPQPPSPSVLQVFMNAAVCTDSEICSRIGRDIFTRQGNVIDSTIASMFCLGMTNMQSMGIGGGFIMNLYIKQERKAYTLDAREISAGAATEDMHLHDPSTTNEGSLSIGVPGELLGYWEAHKRFGSIPWTNLIEPTIKICEQGFTMTRHMEDSIKINPKVVNDSYMRKMLFNETTNEPYRMGSHIQPPKQLCETLRIIADKGGADLYNGSLAEKLANDLKDMGSIITKDDLNEYKVKWSDSIPIDINGDILHVIPPPGSGILLSFLMNILKGFNFTSESISNVNETIRTYHRIVEAFKWTYGKRTQIGDPDFVDIKQLLDDLTSDEYADTVRQKIIDFETVEDTGQYGSKFYVGTDHGTAHISILAPNGDAVSITSSVNFYFGCGLSGKRTGIILNSYMDDFSSPGLKNYFGLPGSPLNFIRPRKRALSSMAPTIVTGQNGDVKLVIGAAGGTKITTAVAMAIMRILWFGQNVKEAVDAPRFHHQLIPMEIEYEFGVQDQVIKELEKIGHITKRYRNRGSIICAIQKNSTGIFANADFRKEGEAFGL